MRVAVGRLHFEHAVADLQDGDVERAAAKVIDDDRAGVLLVEAVGERGRRRLVDDAQHVQAGNLAGVLGRLTLSVVEVGRNGDHRLGDLVAGERFRGLLHLLQDEGGNLARRVFLAVRLDPRVAIIALHDLEGGGLHFALDDLVLIAAADQALDGVKRVVGVGDRLALGGLADETFAVLRERHHRRGGAGAFRIFNDAGVRALHDRDA